MGTSKFKRFVIELNRAETISKVRYRNRPLRLLLKRLWVVQKLWGEKWEDYKDTKHLIN